MKSSYLVLVLAAAFTAIAAAPKEQSKDQAATQKAQVQATAAKKAAPAQQKKEIKINMEALKTPSKLTEKAPETFKVKFTTTKGDFTMSVTRAWSPLGADRFYNLVKNGFFTDVAFFRVIDGFMVQFGIHGDPEISAAWRKANIEDDAVKQSNTKGFVSFATAGPGTRTTQMFINFGDNDRLDGMGFSPFAKVTEGMNVVESIYSGYGEGAPSGRGPDQGRLQMQGNKYLKAEFPRMDYIQTASLLN